MTSSCSVSGRQVILGQTAVLEIDVIDARGNKIDADSLPKVQIVDSRGTVIRELSSDDVVRVEQGRYRFNYTVPQTAATGIWTDHWQAEVNGFTTNSNLNFVVLTAAAAIDAAGAKIGDEPVCCWSEAEICGINNLLAMIKCRLKNDAQSETIDEYGNTVLTNCPIFSDEELVCFLRNSLSEFNQTPHFTNLGFDSPIIYDRNAHIIVEGAVIIAIAAQMLVEAGREFTLSDNGITLNPPPLSTVLNNQLSALLNAHIEKLKQIKWSMKPAPIGFGSFRVLSISPNFLRLRHLRERRIV